MSMDASITGANDVGPALGPQKTYEDGSHSRNIIFVNVCMLNILDVQFSVAS